MSKSPMSESPMSECLMCDRPMSHSPMCEKPMCYSPRIQLTMLCHNYNYSIEFRHEGQHSRKQNSTNAYRKS